MVESLNRRHERLPVFVWAGVLVTLHLVLAFMALNPAPHTGGDNAGYLALARSLFERGRYLSIWQPGTPPQTQYPPVFPALLAAGLAVGLKPWLGLKLIPILFSGIGVGFTFLWLDRRTRRPIALGVALLVAVVPGVVGNAHWLLSDIPFWAFTMMALWAFEAGERGKDGKNREDRRWFAAGVAAVVLAYFTRSAGLPLVLAAILWLLSRRRGRRAAVLLAVFVPMAGLWWLRAHLAGGVPYLQQFLAADPYTPSLGRIGAADLLRRIQVNDASYLFTLLPRLLFGGVGTVPSVVSVLLLLLAVFGWILRIRRPSVAELFVPLYVGLLLVWPQVWAGERFLLPLLPPLLVLAVEALASLGGALTRRMGRRGPRAATFGRRTVSATAIGALVAMLVAAAPPDYALIRRGRGCMSRYRAGQPYACVPSRFRDFIDIAEWARGALPPNAVVVSRKPRVFFVLSGMRGEMFPLDRNPATLLALARRTGARYVVLDHLDQVSTFLLQAVMRRPAAFCTLRYAGPERATLLGITEDADTLPDAVVSRGQDIVVKFRRCGPGYLAR